MTDRSRQQGVAYPPAPWRLTGQAWTGFYDAGTRLALPDGLTPLLNPNWLALTIARYLEGTLQYNELIISALVRRGVRAGIHFHAIWVDEEASLWGGRHIWGIPKERATFVWNTNTVQVTDQRHIVTLDVSAHAPQAPWLWMPAPSFFGFRDGRCLYTLARTQARPGRSEMRVTEWSSRFPYRLTETPLFGLAANPIRITVPQPTVLDD
jgi:Acetoacetate decarboxylase (ADC)